MTANPDIFIFNRNDVRRIKTRAFNAARQNKSPNAPAPFFLHDWAARDLEKRLSVVKREFPTALQIGSRAQINPDSIKGLKHHYLFDNVPTPDAKNLVIGEEDLLPFAACSLDLITSALNLHTVNDLPGALSQIKNALKEDGLFMAAILGGETLHELRDCMTKASMSVKGGVSPHVAPFADKPQMGSLMQRAGFALPVIDSEIITVTYDNMFKLMHDLRAMGETNSLAEKSKSFNNRKLMMKAAELYAHNYAETDENGAPKIVATFEIIFLLGWSPHDSQQKPLRPGAAEHKLAEALGAPETILKESE